MNHLIEYLLVSTAVLTGMVVTVDYIINNFDVNFTSHYDMIKNEKNKKLEMLKIIEFFETPVLRVDVINVGNEDIIIKKIFVDGIEDNSFNIDGVNSKIISLNQVISIEPSINGDTIKIITENNNEYDLGS